MVSRRMLAAFLAAAPAWHLAQVLKIDPLKNECMVLGDMGEGGWKYHGGAAWIVWAGLRLRDGLAMKAGSV